MNILIADSGSTKTDWCVAEDGKILRRIKAGGINPVFLTDEELREAAAEAASLLEDLRPEAIHFYGAGCIPTQAERVIHALRQAFPAADEVEVASDMLGAARALCGRRAGIACILGTGSNSCFYDGENIVANVSPLGFILGDEGSGAVLGKLLVGSLLKNQLTSGLKEAFLEQYALTPADIIERVYRRPLPNRFLASLSPFLAAHLEDAGVHQLVLDAFRDFLRRNVMQYDWQAHDVHCCGSIAWHYKKILAEAGASLGIRIGQVVQSPMEGLVRYHFF
ncbi:MAG TPA: ATPase [Candidatus Bacteroides pullicola]|uniref:ATPase n=1 Tax=Candidatus Bacteroides pullicola TaxID=2838475 RepID=A0A9D1ZGB9_9BACE|nr:ATPase [Candidatus Bacteroides pullicola]